MGVLNYLLCLFFVFEVSSMSLKGPALTRYEPCGLGVIYFDKAVQNYWRGVINLGLYKNLVDAEAVLMFKMDVTVSAHPQANITARRQGKRDLVVNTIGIVPYRFVFYVQQDDLKPNDTNVPFIDSLSLNNVTLCNDQIKASQTIAALNVTHNFSQTKYAKAPYAHVCGRRAIDHEELVSLRTEAEAGDWPWHVAILIKDPNTGESKYECGGNIVSRTTIVTAGHCVSFNNTTVETNRIVIIAGVSNYKDLTQVGRQTFIANELILHPAYNVEDATSDLAVIKVTGLVFTKYVQPICIWGPVYNKSNLFGKEATVVGFGYTEYEKLSETLRSTYIMVQNDTTCIKSVPKLYGRLLNEFTFCAGYGPTAGINPRNGDSGGGLVVSTVQPDHKVSWFLRGVLSKCGVSPGSKRCDPKHYVVYTDVGPHYGWIYNHADLEFRTNVLAS